MTRPTPLDTPKLLLALLLAACGGEDGALDTTLEEADSSLVAGVHETLLDPNNVYSPFMLWQGAQLRMYFGGWATPNQWHDGIYRASCSNPYPCGGAVKVLDPIANGFHHLNDPTIVAMPGSRPYLLMFMTGVELGDEPWALTSQHIYYATSWASDGLSWSRPRRLVTDLWLPSATRGPDGHVYLYGSSTVTGFVERLDLGTTGAAVLRREPVLSDGAPMRHVNVDAMFRPGIGYQMLAETPTSDAIDYLFSADGLRFTKVRPRVVTPAPGMLQVRTPAPHPNTHAWVYLGETASPLADQNRIVFTSWTP